ncbi:MAG: hypothetical protein HOG19_10470, partial [Gammaproteobacteria bacterium]|nr:hypothetical protein [Gammaproteobacteria bacterium]
MGQITQTTTQLQTILNDADASNAGNTSISDASDTSATSLKKSGFYSLQASSSNAPSTDRAVVISAVRDTAATGEIRYGQVVITESNGLWWNSDDGGSLGTWYESVGTTATQTLTNKTLTSPVLTTPQINDSAADHQYVFAVANLAADRTVTLPLLTGADTFVFEAHAQTLTNKTITSAVLNTGVSGSAVLDSDTMSGASATTLSSSESIKAYVDAQVDTADTLAEILAIGNATGGTDIATTTTDKVQFRDAAIYINSSVDGQLDIVADTEIQIAATTVDLNGNLDVSGTALVTGVLTTTATQVATGGITSGSSILSDTDSTDSLGSTGVRWLKGWFDTLTAGTLTIGSGSVTDSSGSISFGNENLTTTGTATAASLALATGATVTGIDNGTIGTSATLLATQGAIKTYVDAQVGTVDTLAEVLAIGNTTGGTDLVVSTGDDVQTLSAGTSNLRIGLGAGAAIASGGNYNVLVGDAAGAAITTGINNAATGYQALTSNTTGSYSTASGYQALYTNTTGNSNTAYGHRALYLNTTGVSNTATGRDALYSNTTGSNNTASGHAALYFNTTGANNTASGHQALFSNTTGASNVASGYE